LIAGGQAALAPKEPRGYEADPTRTDHGEICFVEAEEHLGDNAAKAIGSVRAALAAGIAPEEIAIFYRQRTQLLDELISELEAGGIDYLPERASDYPSSPCIRWLHGVAAYVLGNAGRGSVAFRDLYYYYRSLAEAAGELDQNTDSLDLRTKFYEFVTSQVASAQLLCDWLRLTNAELRVFDLIAKCIDRRDDKEALESLRMACETPGPLEQTTLTDFATDGRIVGKILLTTLHSCKRRQFDVVILPGLIEGITQRWRCLHGQYHQPSQRVLSETRRLFYVGFTRARSTVYLIYSNGYVHKGHLVQLGRSRFVDEIAERIVDE